eukprot:TRINITY_DN3379_c0_g1_i2.p1 TRINITY_DN3379_c0_g1~~TRINITY_DN3379_c0_g1_i2.p1  ORF type:complete len:208 (+),score=50.99 TRINITY_DN3379_c0_g1_i2:227-850(+)
MHRQKNFKCILKIYEDGIRVVKIDRKVSPKSAAHYRVKFNSDNCPFYSFRKIKKFGYHLQLSVFSFLLQDTSQIKNKRKKIPEGFIEFRYNTPELELVEKSIIKYNVESEYIGDPDEVSESESSNEMKKRRKSLVYKPSNIINIDESYTSDSSDYTEGSSSSDYISEPVPVFPLEDSTESYNSDEYVSSEESGDTTSASRTEASNVL